jgi:hypothetical protein
MQRAVRGRLVVSGVELDVPRGLSYTPGTGVSPVVTEPPAINA